MNKYYDEEINKNQLELDAIKAQMEELRLEFVNYATDFVEKLYKDQSEDKIKTNPDITLNLEQEQLKKMKEQIIKLIEDVKEITAEGLSSKEFWWHLKEFELGFLRPYFFFDNDPPKILDKALRLICGKLGVIFREYGYLKSSESWLEYDSLGRFHPRNARSYYPDYQRLYWSDEMKNCMIKYSELCKKAGNLRNQINSLIRAKKTQNAKQRWDSI